MTQYITPYVVLQAPNDGYFWVVKAASDKHFSLADSGWREFESGTWDECLEMMRDYEAMFQDSVLNLICIESYSQIQTTEECLIEILKLQPDFLNNKEFI